MGREWASETGHCCGQLDIMLPRGPLRNLVEHFRIVPLREEEAGVFIYKLLLLFG